MDRLEQAQARLDKALARLEKASSAPAPDAGREIETLRKRCDTLEARSSQVADRLDTAIGKIRGILEG